MTPIKIPKITNAKSIICANAQFSINFILSPMFNRDSVMLLIKPRADIITIKHIEIICVVLSLYNENVYKISSKVKYRRVKRKKAIMINEIDTFPSILKSAFVMVSNQPLISNSFSKTGSVLAAILDTISGADGSFIFGSAGSVSADGIVGSGVVAVVEGVAAGGDGGIVGDGGSVWATARLINKIVRMI